MTVASTPAGHPWRDARTMLRRDLVHLWRYPSLTIMLIGQPVVFLLLFVYVFGQTLGRGLPGTASTAGGGRHAYLAFVTPTIAVIAVASIALGTAVSVAMDATGGMMARFRTMAISPSSFPAGHVLGAMVRTAIALAVVIGIAVAVGYRSSAPAADWAAAAGILLAFGLALTWLTVALGLAAKTVESASNTPLVLMLFPFLGSGFVPTSQMPGWLDAFGRNQPYTPVMTAVRTLLAGHPDGHAALLALAWSVGIAVVGFAWSRRLFATRAVR